MLLCSFSLPDVSLHRCKMAQLCIALLAKRAAKQRTSVALSSSSCKMEVHVQQLLGLFSGIHAIVLCCTAEAGMPVCMARSIYCMQFAAAVHLQKVLTSSLDSTSEDVKAAASQALGGVAIGNLSAYLPFILNQIQSQVSKQGVTLCVKHACIDLDVQSLPGCMDTSRCCKISCLVATSAPASVLFVFVLICQELDAKSLDRKRCACMTHYPGHVK